MDARLTLVTSSISHLFSRPRKLTDVAHQDDVVDALKNTLKSGNVRCSSARPRDLLQLVVSTLEICTFALMNCL